MLFFWPECSFLLKLLLDKVKDIFLKYPKQCLVIWSWYTFKRIISENEGFKSDLCTISTNYF